MRKFWKKTEGFTLVELIVVIAILGILAGVGTVGYSGYVKKANMAADQQLLASLNSAFAAACAANGENHVDRRDVSITLAGEVGAKKVDETSVVVTGISNFAASFDVFFEEGEFKVFSNLIYDAKLGGFKDPTTAETLILAYGDGFVQVTGEAINALLNSTYYSEGMGSEKLMKQVDSVSKLAGGMGSILNVMGTDGYVNAALNALGITPTDSAETNRNLMNARATELALKEMGLTSIDQVEDGVNKDEFLAITKRISENALVLYTAQSTTKMDAAEAKALLNDVSSDMIKNAMNNGVTDEIKANGMNQAALAYGMYYAYVNSDACTKNLEKTNIAAGHVIDALDTNEEFRAYISSEQGTKDMEAYLQALKVVNSSTQSPEAVEKLVVEGFTDPDLLAILTQTMGK